MIDQKYLAKKHGGMRVSASGLLKTFHTPKIIEPGDIFLLGEFEKHLNEMATRFYDGDITVVDEFLQLYCLDEKRPK
jgi:hypothetical protein